MGRLFVCWYGTVCVLGFLSNALLTGLWIARTWFLVFTCGFLLYDVDGTFGRVVFEFAL